MQRGDHRGRRGAVEAASELDDVAFFSRYSLYRFEVRDFRSFSAHGLTVDGQQLPLDLFSATASRTDWVYFADQPAADAPPWAIRLPLPAGGVATHYNPDGVVAAIAKLLKMPHVRSLDEAVGLAMQRAQAIFNDPTIQPPHYTRADSGGFGTLLHRETSLIMREKPRWATNVWINRTTREVMSVNDPDFRVTGDVMEVDLAYLKRGRTIQLGQSFNPDDVIHAYEIKTSSTGRIRSDQRDNYRLVMNNRNPIAVQTRLRQQAGAGRWLVAENPVALRKIRWRRNAAVAGSAFMVFNTAMAMASPNVDEDAAFQDLLISVDHYRDVRGVNDADAKLTMIDIVDRLRIWLTAATGDPSVSNVASLVFAYKLIEREWQ